MNMATYEAIGEKLEHSGMTDDEIDAYFAHYGVPGMKWGKRKQKRLDRIERVGSGTANRRDKLRVGLTEVSTASLLRNGGLKGAAASKSKRMQGRKERMERGEATVKDIINNYGGDRLFDFG